MMSHLFYPRIPFYMVLYTRLADLNSPTSTARMSDGKLWIKTPLIRSSTLSERLDAEVYLKIEVRPAPFSHCFIGTDHIQRSQTFQKGRSFKVGTLLSDCQISCDQPTVVKGRGIAHFVNEAIRAYAHAQQSDPSTVPPPLDTPSIAARAALAGVRASPGPTPTGGAGAGAGALPQLIVASGGNAGIAAAAAARALDVRCTVFLPSSAAGLVGVLAREGPPGGKTDVRVGGENYQ